LESAANEAADMTTLVIVGTRETRVIERPGRSPLVYTPRSIPRALAEAIA
jgi:precorrin-3B C17-methyltransferase